MVSRPLACLFVAGSAACVVSCSLVAGLGDYELAKGDASAVDAVADGPSADVVD